MLVMAKKLPRILKAEYLRLLVVDINKPAVNFYEKMALTKPVVYIMKFLMMALNFVNLDMKSNYK